MTKSDEVINHEDQRVVSLHQCEDKSHIVARTTIFSELPLENVISHIYVYALTNIEQEMFFYSYNLFNSH